MTLFSYLWLYIPNNIRNRNSGAFAGITRETDRGVYRDDITIYTCKYMYEEDQYEEYW